MNYLLLESGDKLILEDGSGFLLLDFNDAVTQPSGGWAFLNTYDSELQRRRALARKRRELEEETEAIQDDIDRNIAQLLREQEAIDDKKADLYRLGELARQEADIEAARAFSERVGVAYARAIAKGTYSALEALDRELQRARDEEMFLLEAFMLLQD